MKIVIDIDEEIYEMVMNTGTFGKYRFNTARAIKNGIPLPKNHGRLIDAGKLKVELECGIRAGNYEEGYENYAHINDIDDCVDAVVYADTIIEADNEREGEE